jgi:hypothetical protein
LTVVSKASIDYYELYRRIIAAEDAHSVLQWEHLMEHGLDAHLICRYYTLDDTHYLDKASRYWVQTSYTHPFDGELRLPPHIKGVSIYTRRAFAYPHLIVVSKLPQLRLVGNENTVSFFIGLEHGAELFGGIAAFLQQTTTEFTDRLQVIVGTWRNNTILNIDAAKPTNYAMGRNQYRIFLTRNLVLFFINDRLRAVAIQSSEGAVVKVRENVPPYSIALIPPLPPRMTAFIELSTIGRTVTASDYIRAPVPPYAFRVSDGKGVVPLQLPLYLEDSDTKLAGYSVSSGSVTSHPFPIWGYTNSTLLFMANKHGTLDIQVYTSSGSWRSYDTFHIIADKLVKYRFSDALPLARLVFTPSEYPATISEAEIVLAPCMTCEEETYAIW